MGHHKSKMVRISGGGSLRSLSTTNLNGMSQDINCLIDTEEYTGVTPLWLAVRYNDNELVEQLLAARAKVNHQCGMLQMTPLHMAAYNHNIDVVRLLLRAGADPNVLDHWNYTPLMYAAIHYDPYVVESLFLVLIEHGCDVNYGATLDAAGNLEREGINTEVPKLQSSHDFNYITYVREPMGPSSGTALHLAVQNPHLTRDNLRTLLCANADVDKANIYGQTPLMGAMLDIYYDYHSEVKGHAEMLMHHGTNLNAQDIRGWTCFHYAAQRGQIGCMDLLLKGGADCNFKSINGETPLWLLLGNGWHEGVQYLIFNGCNLEDPIKSTVVLGFNQNIDICRYGEIHPIEFAISNRYYDIAKLMLRTGCRVDETTWLGGPDAPELPSTLQTKRDEFLQFVVDFFTKRTEPESLRNCCRTVLRASLKQAIGVKLDQLTLPQQIKDFICFKDQL